MRYGRSNDVQSTMHPSRTSPFWIRYVSRRARLSLFVALRPSTKMKAASMRSLENHKEIAVFLVREGHCESREEAMAILEALQEDESLADYVLDWTQSSAKQLDEFLRISGNDHHEHDNENESVDEERETPVEEANEDDDDEIHIGPGECALCERFMKLTRHHLIPKATWGKIESSKHRFQVLMESLEIEQPCSFRSLVRAHVIDICRPCHSHIHRTYDHWTLATTYNTLDRLVDDPAIRRFAKWAHQQRVPNAVVVRSNRRIKKAK